MLLFLGLLINSLVNPPNNTYKRTVQGSEAVLIDVVNPFWYQTIDISKGKSESFDSDIGLIECNDLSYITSSHVGYYHGHKATSDTYEQLIHLEQFAYLLEGSWLHLIINITNPPVISNANISLLYFTSYDEYYKLTNTDTASNPHYDRSTHLNYTTLNHVSINITKSSFNYFAIQKPNGTDFTYNVSLSRVSYNDSNVDYLCSIGAVHNTCTLSLNVTGESQLCMMEYCPSVNVDLDLHWMFNCIVDISMSLHVLSLL